LASGPFMLLKAADLRDYRSVSPQLHWFWELCEWNG